MSEPALIPRLECRISHTPPLQVTNLTFTNVSRWSMSMFPGQVWNVCEALLLNGFRHQPKLLQRCGWAATRDIGGKRWILTRSYWYCMVFPWLEVGGSPACEAEWKKREPFFSAVHWGVCKGKDPSVKFKQVLSEDLKWPRSTLELFSCVFPVTLSHNGAPGSLVCLSSSR